MPIFDGEFRETSTRGPFPSGLHQAGPCLPIEIAVPTPLNSYLTAHNQPIPSPVSGVALIDTGATRSCVDIRVINSIGVNPIGTTSLGTAHGRYQTNLYPAKFNFSGGMNFTIEFSSTIGVDLSGQSLGNMQIIALIGRDVLSRSLFVYHGTLGTFSISL